MLQIIAHFGKEWQPGTQTKGTRNYGIIRGNRSSSHLEFNLTRHASCCVPLCTNSLRNTPGFVFYRIPKARCIVREYVRLLQNANLKLNSDSTRICILLVFLEVKLPQAHLPLASLFQVPFLSIPPSVFLFWTVLTPLVHSTSLSTKFVYIHVPPK